MRKNNLCCLCSSFTNAQLPLLKVAAVWFDKLVILDPVGASWDTVGAEWLHDWRDGKGTLQENGLQYLLRRSKTTRAKQLPKTEENDE